MKSFSRLIKNEFIKIVGQTSYKVLCIILGILFLIVPLFNLVLPRVIDNVFGSSGSIEDTINDLENSKEYCQDNDYLEFNYINAKIDSLRDFASAGLDYDSWQYRFYYESYLNILMKIELYEILYNESATEKQIEDSYFSYIYQNIEKSDKDGYTEKINELSAQKDNLIETYKKQTVNDFYNTNIDNLASYSQALDMEIADTEAQYIYNPSDELKYRTECYKLNKEALLILSDSFEYLVKNDCKLNTWKSETVLVLMSGTYNQISQENIISNEEYSKSGEISATYNEYLKGTLASVKNKTDIMKSYKYSLFNNIPLQSSQSISTKSIFRNSVLSCIDIIFFSLIILASYILSSEFSSGTARLLFIRPHKKNTILLSKYICLLLTALILLISSVILSFLVSVSVNGFGDVFTPDIDLTGDSLSVKPSFVSFSKTVLFSMVRIFFIATLSFMISVLTKKALFGLIGGFGINAISGLLNTVSVSFPDTFFKHTIFPYYHYEIYSSNYLETVSTMNFGINYSIPEYLISYHTANCFNPVYGICHYGILFFALIVATFIAFRKKEIL